MAIPTSRMLRPTLHVPSTSCDTAFSFLVSPAQCTRRMPLARFSTSPSLWRSDNNKSRGVSAVRRTGLRPRQTLSVRERDYENQTLPMPVKPTSQVEGDPDHGLWEFFKDRKLLRTPVEESRHGRAWTVHELRDRDWETLQQLWWVCVKERNRLATATIEHRRQGAGYGDLEMEERDETVQKTMKAIIDTLVERNSAYQEARVLAKHDSTIDLSRPGHQYQESPYTVDEIYDYAEPLDDTPGAVPREVSGEQVPKT